MKNFKKVLALVLAVATVFSFAAMATAADVKYADLTDTASIKHVEAVQVLTGLGVIQGFEDKTFKPAESVTRVQMAKMVGFIMNDGDDINDLYKNACPFADSKSNWGAGYIAYCATQGIVNGRNANTFDPNATVTGAEAAKMLLCALGYDAAIEGFTGADWSVNVLNVAKKAGLLTDLSQGKMGAALNREDAAQMIFNALKAEEVEYDTKGTTVTINGATIATGASKASTVETVHEQFGAKRDTKTPLLWGEEHFIVNAEDAKLKHLDKGTDAWGVASTAWYYGKDDDKKDIEISKTLTLAQTFTGSVNAEEFYALTGKITEDDTITVYVDGVADNITPKGVALTEWKNGKVVNDYSAKNRAKNKLIADVIEVYVDDKDNADGRTIQIIGKNYYFGQVDDHTEAKTLTEKENITVNGLTYETTAFTDEDVDNETKVIYTVVKDKTTKAEKEIKSVAKVEAVKSGKVTKVAADEDKNTVITADGKTYTFKGTVSVDIDDELDLYLDPNGKVISFEKTEAGASDYFMVLSKAANTNNQTLDTGTSSTYQVRLLGTDGKTVDLKVAQIYNADEKKMVDVNADNWATVNAVVSKKADNTLQAVPDEDTDITKSVAGSVVTYTLTNKGEAKLTVLAAKDTPADKTTKVNTKTDKFSYDNLTNVTTFLTGTKASGRTAFVLISLDKNGNYVFTPFSGISAMKAALGNYYYYNNVTVNDKADDKTATPVTAAAAFYFVDSRNETATKTVFTNLGVSDKQSVKVDANTKYDFYEVNVIEGGTVKTLKVLDSAFNNTAFSIASSYALNDDGYVKSITAANSDLLKTATYDEGDIDYDDGVLTIETQQYLNDNIKVYLWDAEEEEFDVKSVSSLKKGDIEVGSTFAYQLNTTDNNTTKTVVAIYVGIKSAT